ncbi:MAG: ABC transporter permease [Microcoleus sp. PH2017_29_MFU_D_A]|uniref:ABC transporter permease n=1 Tax=unclassified Microcoleus TaxID=2642155 RepID=UPI001DC76A56|nr:MULTISPECIES: ABC transporter permease [unclassified Microcoleus]MCC3419318.1 ABC transporter permease [Microcoleus sp. PH2017_07_MST_O_A]MCC3431187.1 ABC transporter permease [Microcoleus sp. PH2017_04_SCI_O_A]MCC3444001.1 ABC transporter permease [Microcoleus sp. PH2017_03_ELD_O_A]MCC3468013.1 ABC transporter permease [Microcoleus sp. PH2017_06_SFM_O_A]MCC3504082.1 ABC transporter permease [Microcoleus sp. PH2017_19_SFW_U_A]MCC3511376.1 ABC transporter permease [Microcoleus sp. PH2017_17
MRNAGQLVYRRQVAHFFDLLRELVDRDMKLLYKRSALGIAWTLINPLLQLAVFSFVFRSVIPINIPKYSSFAFSGLLIWTWTQSALFQATGLITSNRALIRQPNFPIAILPVVTTATGLIHFLLALPVLMIFLIIDGLQPNSVLFFLPVLLVIQFFLTVGLAYPLAALNVTFRDTQHTLGVLLQMLFYLTPIFYDLNSVPKEYLIFYQLNPMVPLIEAYRAVLLRGTQPDWMALLIVSVVVAALLPIGLGIFRRQSDRFVEEL